MISKSDFYETNRPETEEKIPRNDKGVVTRLGIKGGTATLTASSQRHTLPNREYVHSNSEVIILNIDQHQHQRIISTNNRIN